MTLWMVTSVSPPLCFRLKYLNNYWMDCREILYRHSWSLRMNPTANDPLSFPLTPPWGCNTNDIPFSHSCTLCFFSHRTGRHFNQQGDARQRHCERWITFQNKFYFFKYMINTQMYTRLARISEYAAWAYLTYSAIPKCIAVLLSNGGLRSGRVFLQLRRKERELAYKMYCRKNI